ncbi:HGxxPAAW family protein [Streptomyces aurantiacus]|uniref:HGxxPAAW family protein n=1 Tax=Streptomyces aurantiacus TaxID=47760 RepID=UPI00099ED73A|nr:HGxxPAAW family protein [Streptomyces aurantiacus]
MSGHQHDEGHTLAGWAGTATAVVGASVAGAGMCLGSVAGIGLGLGVVGLSVLVTWGLHLAGWGKPSGIRPVAEWGLRVRDRAARAGHPGCVGCRLAGRRASAAEAVKRGANGARPPEPSIGVDVSASVYARE